MSRLPWWAWALIASLVVLAVMVAIPPLRDFVVEAVGALGALAFGVRSTQRRSAARDVSTAAQESITERAEVEAVQTEERRERAAERVDAADAETVRRDVPTTPEEREERLSKVVDPFA